MALATGRLNVLDPTAGPQTEPVVRAKRPADLAGKRIGFLDNGKRNSDKLLRYLDELLQERCGIADSLHRRKPTASRVVPAELLDELAGECDLVIPGVGD